VRRRSDDAPPPQPTAAPAPVNWLEQATHRRVTVHTVKDQSIEGTLVLAADDGLLLWSAQMLSNPRPVQLDGEVFIPRGQVLFVQTVRM
jgi:hypothetical protein